MKTCGYQKQIDLYLDNELSGENLRAFEAHLQACPQCSAIVEQTRGMLDDLHAQPEMDVPPGLQERLHAALLMETEKGDVQVKRKVNPWALTAIAAALVVCLVSGLAVGSGLLMRRDSSNLLQSKSGADLNQDYNGLAAESAEQPQAAATEAPGALMDTATADDAQPESEDGALRSVVKGEESFGANQTLAGDGRKLIYTASLIVESREYSACMDTVMTIITKYGGYVEASQSYGVPEANGDSQGRTSVITMRMPIDQYGSVMGDLQGLGNVLSKYENTEDVSRQYVDTEARNKTLTLQRDKFYELLEKTDTMESIIALQSAITDLTTQIEQMTAQLRFWDDKVAYSSITVEVREIVTPKSIEPADPDLGTRVNGAFYDTLNSMRSGAESFAVGFVGFLPWLALLLAVGGILTAILIPATQKARKAAKARRADDHKKEE